MLSILLPAARRTAPGQVPQSVWGDLRVALASVDAYASGIEVVVGWKGDERPENLPPNPCMRLIPQPADIRTGSEAWNWCAAQTDAEELIILGDDNVLHPDTIRLLVEDVRELRRKVDLLGAVGCRSNYVKGAQNIRMPNGSTSLGMAFPSEGSVIEAPMVVPVAAWVDHAAFDRVEGFPPTNWFADDLFCWDLGKLGYRHFVSRAYVHHVGERATGQGKNHRVLLEEGLEWLRINRPDFCAEALGLPMPVAPAAP